MNSRRRIAFSKLEGQHRSGPSPMSGSGKLHIGQCSALGHQRKPPMIFNRRAGARSPTVTHPGGTDRL